MSRYPAGSGLRSCGMCGGSGKIDVPKVDRKTGQRYRKSEKCRACKGKGWIGVPHRIRKKK